MSEHKQLRRELGLGDATLLGLGSILGTGAFVSIGLVSLGLGLWTALALVLAGGVALCNALSSAQLAASYPRSGGTYEYGYELLHPWAGFGAGWMFLVAKSASAGAAALGFGSYVSNALDAPDAAMWIAVGTVVAMTTLVATGVKRSARVNLLLVGTTISALLIFIVAGGIEIFIHDNWRAYPTKPLNWDLLWPATALMFVGYTGYGRVATLGEEVRDPQRTIPKAILATLFVSVALYVGVAIAGIGVAGGRGFAAATENGGAPLSIVAEEFGYPLLPELLLVGAATAMLGVLLNLLLGLSRVLLAMGRRRDLPRGFAVVGEKHSTPWPAVIAIGIVIARIASLDDLKQAWSLSAFTVLLYYGMTNLAALRLKPEQRLYPRAFAVVGLIACIALAFQVDQAAWIDGGILLAAGFVLRALSRAWESRRPTP